MATDKTFKVVGVSKHEGEYKVRFANDIMRIKILAKNGHEDIRLAELPQALTKLEAVLAIANMDEYADIAAQACINDWISENGPKVRAAKGPAVTRTSKVAETKVTEDDDVPF